MPRHLKTDLLDQVLLGSDVGSAIVFTRTKHGADRLTRQLQRRGHSVAALHGDRSQSQRERALGDLRRGRVQILVATDIASRGIDVDDISHVVNYDVPHTPEDYVHRIGRTARVQALGDAFTLMSPEEKKDLVAIERFLGHSIPRVIIPDFDYKRPADQVRGEPQRRGREGSRRGGSGSRLTRERDRYSEAGGPAKGRGHGGAPSPGATTGAIPGRRNSRPAPDDHGRRRRLNVPSRGGRRM